MQAVGISVKRGASFPCAGDQATRRMKPEIRAHEMSAKRVRPCLQLMFTSAVLIPTASTACDLRAWWRKKVGRAESTVLDLREHMSRGGKNRRSLNLPARINVSADGHR